MREYTDKVMDLVEDLGIDYELIFGELLYWFSEEEIKNWYLKSPFWSEYNDD